MAQALHHDQTALIAELSATSAADINPGNTPSGSERSNAVVSTPLVQNVCQVTASLHRAADRIFFLFDEFYTGQYCSKVRSREWSIGYVDNLQFSFRINDKETRL